MEIYLLKDQFKALVEKIDLLNLSLGAGSAVYAAKESGAFSFGVDAIDLFRSSYRSLWYEDGVADGRFTPIWLGSMAVEQAVLNIALEVNELKDQFQASVIAAKASLRDGRVLSNAGVDKSFRRLMADIGFSKLSLRMAYRHVPVIQRTPISIRFSYSSSGKSISRITPEQALKELLETGYSGAHIAYQAKILGSIAPDTQLAKVQNLAGYYKANVRFEHQPLKQTIPTFLPILYLSGDRSPDHQMEIPEPSMTYKRLRKDRKLCSIPLIPTLRVHAYR
jgi:hypothetical protein